MPVLYVFFPAWRFGSQSADRSANQLQSQSLHRAELVLHSGLMGKFYQPDRGMLQPTVVKRLEGSWWLRMENGQEANFGGNRGGQAGRSRAFKAGVKARRRNKATPPKSLDSWQPGMELK